MGRARQDLQSFREQTAEQQREAEEVRAETLTLIERERESRRQLGEMERTLQERWSALEAEREEQSRERQTLERLSEELVRRRTVLDPREEFLRLAEAEERVARLAESAKTLTREVERLAPLEEVLRKRVAVLAAALEERQLTWRENEEKARGERRGVELREGALARRTASVEQREQHAEALLRELMRVVDCVRH